VGVKGGVWVELSLQDGKCVCMCVFGGGGGGGYVTGRFSRHGDEGGWPGQGMWGSGSVVSSGEVGAC
jgi:hypothetical protein